ncbi:MAG: hypothetical protein FJY10_06085 [Bacteroidetes bacterium]|nr:hypothetical protein [Bacteroidota bacterium]
MTTNESNDPICCPPFDPAPWDGKTFQWDQKKFIRDHVCTIFFMPLNFGQVMKRLNRKVESAGANMPDWLCLSDHTSKWNMDVYLAVDREVPGAENTTLSGKFFAKVYEGSYNETGKWCKDFEGLVSSQNMKMKKMYKWYTTCPKCARKYGKNYVVIVGEIG